MTRIAVYADWMGLEEAMRIAIARGHCGSSETTSVRFSMTAKILARRPWYGCVSWKPRSET